MADGPRPFRPLIVINSLWQGGAEQSTVEVVLRVAAHGASPLVLSLRGDPTPLADRLRAEGVEVQRVATPSLVAKWWAIRRLLRSERPDLVHAVLFESTALALLARVGTRVPVLVSAVSTPQHQVEPGTRLPVKRRIARSIERRSFCRADTIHAVTQGVADALVEVHHLDPARIEVVERGRSPEAFPRRDDAARKRARARVGLEASDRVVLCVARHEPDKGLDLLVPAFDSLEDPDLRVLVAGRDGSASEDLREAIAGSGHPDRYRILGERSDVADLLAAADVFLLPSRREGAAGAAIEAMAVGTPMVVADLPGLAGVVEPDRHALMVPADDPAALARATVRLLDDRNLADQLVEAAHELFLERFTLDRMARRMDDLYHRVASWS